MSNVIDLDSHRDKRDDGCTLRRTERTIKVLGSHYTVITLRGSTGRGWFSVRDDQGRIIFVRLLGFPEDLIGDLIVAWLDGRSVGRQDGINAWRKPSTGGDLL